MTHKEMDRRQKTESFQSSQHVDAPLPQYHHSVDVVCAFIKHLNKNNLQC